MKLRRSVIAVVATFLLGVICVVVFQRYYYVLRSGQRTSDPEFETYRIDDARRLVLGPDAALLINTQEHVVVSLSPSHGRRLGPVVLWPRDATHGVVLGDGIKGDVRDRYHFIVGGVEIQYRSPVANHELHVTL